MKSDRRHELRENVLAKDLSLAGEFVRVHLNWIIGGAAAIILLASIVYYAVSHARASRQLEWATYNQLLINGGADQADRRKKLLDLAEGTSQEPLAAWSYLQVGNLAYKELMVKLPALDEPGKQQLVKEAHDAFEQVTSRYSSQVEPAAYAYIGLGLLDETQRQLDQAKQEYQKAADLAAQGAPLAAAEAQKHIQAVEGLRQPILMAPGTPPSTATAPAGGSATGAELPPIVPEAPASAPTTQPG